MPARALGLLLAAALAAGPPLVPAILVAARPGEVTLWLHRRLVTLPLAPDAAVSERGHPVRPQELSPGAVQVAQVDGRITRLVDTAGEPPGTVVGVITVLKLHRGQLLLRRPLLWPPRLRRCLEAHHRSWLSCLRLLAPGHPAPFQLLSPSVLAGYVTVRLDAQTQVFADGTAVSPSTLSRGDRVLVIPRASQGPCRLQSSWDRLLCAALSPVESAEGLTAAAIAVFPSPPEGR